MLKLKENSRKIKDKKIIVFKKEEDIVLEENGHNQNLFIVQIEEISVNGKSFKKATQKKISY